MKLFTCTIIAFFAVGCGSSPETGDTAVKAVSCETPGSTYLETFSQLSGNCGPIPQEIFNVNDDGTVTESTVISCASSQHNGCSIMYSDCTWTANGYIFTDTGSVKYMSDGSSGSGIFTLQGTGNNQTCTSTYDISIVRQ